MVAACRETYGRRRTAVPPLRQNPPLRKAGRKSDHQDSGPKRVERRAGSRWSVCVPAHPALVRRCGRQRTAQTKGAERTVCGETTRGGAKELIRREGIKHMVRMLTRMGGGQDGIFWERVGRALGMPKHDVQMAVRPIERHFMLLVCKNCQRPRPRAVARYPRRQEEQREERSQSNRPSRDTLLGGHGQWTVGTAISKSSKLEQVPLRREG